MNTNLWVDDVRPAPEGYVWVKTAPEAIALIEEIGLADIEIISLDHDLGAPENGTGYDVVKWIEEQVHTNPPFDMPFAIVCHSANPVGRKNIETAIASVWHTWYSKIGER